MPLGARQGVLVVGRQDGHGLGRAAHLEVFITKYKSKHCRETKISVTELASGPLVRFSATEEVPRTRPRAVSRPYCWTQRVWLRHLWWPALKGQRGLRKTERKEGIKEGREQGKWKRLAVSQYLVILGSALERSLVFNGFPLLVISCLSSQRSGIQQVSCLLL